MYPKERELALKRAFSRSFLSDPAEAASKVI
jgi:hypothetical protein